MPLCLFSVKRVDEWPTKTDGVSLFLVKGETVDEHPQAWTMKTIHPWIASLCKEAPKAGKYVWIGWKQARNYGEGDIVTCELDNSAFQYDAQPAEKAV